MNATPVPVVSSRYRVRRRAAERDQSVEAGLARDVREREAERRLILRRRAAGFRHDGHRGNHRGRAGDGAEHYHDGGMLPPQVRGQAARRVELGRASARAPVRRSASAS